MPDDEILLSNLREWLEAMFGSLTAASISIGKSRGFFGQYYARRVVPSRRVLKALAPHGFNVDDFFAGKLRRLERGPSGRMQAHSSARRTSTHQDPPADDMYLDILWDSAARYTKIAPTWDQLDTSTRKRLLHRVSKYILDIQIELFLERPIEDQAMEPGESSS